MYKPPKTKPGSPIVNFCIYDRCLDQWPTLRGCQLKEVRYVGGAKVWEEALQLMKHEQPSVAFLHLETRDRSDESILTECSEINPTLKKVIIAEPVNEHGFWEVCSGFAEGCVRRPASPQHCAEIVREVARGGFPICSDVVSLQVEVLRKKFARMISKEYGLTEREKAILTLLIHGTPDKEIANELGIQVRTIHAHNANLFRKLGVCSRKEVIHMFGDASK